MDCRNSATSQIPKVGARGLPIVEMRRNDIFQWDLYDPCNYSGPTGATGKQESLPTGLCQDHTLQVASPLTHDFKHGKP
jgi:hypothetical protein